MKTINMLILTILLLLSCERNWDNLLSTDDDLKNTPNIIQINLDSDKNISIILNYSYSDMSSIVLERRSVGGFETINYIRESQTTLTDTSFDKENNHNFVYRVSVTKDEYRSSYSDEKSFSFTSTGLNNPESLVAVSVEMQGIRLEWKDESNYEDSYAVEKDEGSGYTEIATLSPNTESYFDAISGTPPSPLQLDYRVKAYSTALESDWVGITTTYSGMGSPTNLRITNTSTSNFTIEWNDNSSIETAYLIERKVDSGSFTQLAEVNANTTTYSDTISTIGIYGYRVRAKQNNIYSSYSNEVSQNITSLIPTEGLIAYYPFNGNANDESGNGNNGVVYGASLTNDRFSNSNSAYDFDGIDDYIDVQDSPQLDFGTYDFAISLWIKTTQTPTGNNWPMIITKCNIVNPFPGTGFQINLHPDNAGIIAFGIWVNINEKFVHNTGSIVLVNDNIWHHIIAQKDSTEIELFLDGNFEQINTHNFGSLSNNVPLRFGRHSGNGNNPYDGFIDDVRIYNRTLSEEEIQALYYEGGWTK